jgi:hypothetical protein
MPTSSPSVERADEGLGIGVVGAAIAVGAWGLSGVIAKNIEMGALAIAAYRFAIYAVVVGTFMAARGTPITLRVLRHSFWGGIALAADVALFFTAVKLTTIVNATMAVVLAALAGIVSRQSVAASTRR